MFLGPNVTLNQSAPPRLGVRRVIRTTGRGLRPE